MSEPLTSRAGETATPDLYPTRGEETRLLPRLDPVCWSAADTPPPVEARLIGDFDRDGFCILDSVFSLREVEALLAEVQRLQTDAATLNADTLITEPGSGQLRSVFSLHTQSPVFAALAADARLLPLAKYLLGGAVYLHQSRLNVKVGFDGESFQWHSDFETWHAEDGLPRMRTVSMTVLLHDNNSLNGPLMLMPGSHRCFLACAGATPDAHYLHSLRRQEYGIPTDAQLTALAARYGIRVATGSAGSVVVFDCNVLHGSFNNMTPWPRGNAYFVYNALDNRPVMPFAAQGIRPEFVAAREHIVPLEP